MKFYNDCRSAAQQDDMTALAIFMTLDPYAKDGILEQETLDNITPTTFEKIVDGLKQFFNCFISYLKLGNPISSQRKTASSGLSLSQQQKNHSRCLL